MWALVDGQYNPAWSFVSTGVPHAPKLAISLSPYKYARYGLLLLKLYMGVQAWTCPQMAFLKMVPAWYMGQHDCHNSI